MLRLVLAVAVSAALLGLAVPAIETAGTAHSETRVTDELDRLETTARTLTLRSDATPHGPPARETTTLRLPARTWAHPGVTRLRFGRNRVTWRVGDRDPASRTLTGPLSGPPGGLVLRDGGRVDLVLVRRQGAVVVRRPNFITRNATTPGHEPARVAVTGR